MHAESAFNHVANGCVLQGPQAAVYLEVSVQHCYVDIQKLRHLFGDEKSV